MYQHKLDKDEIKEIAHFITKRSIKTQSGEYLTATKEYLETYNQVTDELEKYNSTC